jgi:hypothetical protein
LGNRGKFWGIGTAIDFSKTGHGGALWGMLRLPRYPDFQRAYIPRVSPTDPRAPLLQIPGALRIWRSLAQRREAQNPHSDLLSKKEFLPRPDFPSAARCAIELALRSANRSSRRPPPRLR